MSIKRRILNIATEEKSSHSLFPIGKLSGMFCLMEKAWHRTKETIQNVYVCKNTGIL